MTTKQGRCSPMMTYMKSYLISARDSLEADLRTPSHVDSTDPENGVLCNTGTGKKTMHSKSLENDKYQDDHKATNRFDMKKVRLTEVQEDIESGTSRSVASGGWIDMAAGGHLEPKPGTSRSVAPALYELVDEAAVHPAQPARSAKAKPHMYEPSDNADLARRMGERAKATGDVEHHQPWRAWVSPDVSKLAWSHPW